MLDMPKLSITCNDNDAKSENQQVQMTLGT